MDFVKMEGLGNDFVVVEGPRAVTAEDARRWCDRRRGIGGDGVLVATPREGGVAMFYRNADGSHSETCGNGVRCVARLAFDRGWVDGPSFVVETDAGDNPVVVDGSGGVRARLWQGAVEFGEAVELAGYRFTPLSLGNPHAVAVVDDVFATPVTTVGPIVEGDAAFTGRTNVEFVNPVEGGGVAARVWERGVGETMASGTGAVAAAAVARRQGLAGDRVEVSLAGGTLVVEFSGDEIWTEGPADYVFSGTLLA